MTRRTVSPDVATAIAKVRHGCPCSVVLPAGAGKTHLIAHVIQAISEEGERALLLTHTNAGVDAMRRRLRRLGVQQAARVRTIAGWSLDVVGRLPQLSGITVPAEPDWEQSSSYVLAATRAVGSAAVQDVLRASYDLVLVDEYQDCSASQHALITALSAVLPVAIFGDPLQALFGFDEDPPPEWSQVEAAFPPVTLGSAPERWRQTNPQLGAWLITVRERLLCNEAVELDTRVVRWIEAGDPRTRTRTCLAQPSDGSVVALGKFRQDCAAAAKTLKGTYAVMEELEGRVLMDYAKIVDAADASLVSATVEFAVASGSGLAEAFSADKRRRLREGKAIATKKEALAPVYDAVNRLRTTPSPSNAALALRELGAVPGFRLSCREAWYGILDAIDYATTAPDLTVRGAVIRSRNRTRVVGRRADSRVVSRPRLVKGLEYDHAVLLDADRFDATELYVALTRPRRSLTVFSAEPVLDSHRA